MTRTNREVYQVFQAIDREPQYQGLTAEFVLRNIPRGLCTHHEDSAWLSCRFCERRGQRLKLPNEMGVTNHFAQSRHNNAEADPEAAAASPERPSMWSTQPRPASTQPPPEPVPDTPPPWLPPAAVTGSGLGSDCHPYRHNSPPPQWDTAPLILLQDATGPRWRP